MNVEIWTVGDKDSKHYILVDRGEVINGGYDIKTDKEKNQVYIPFTNKTREAHYLGDVLFDENYNKTIQNYEDMKEIVGFNTIKIKEQKEDNNSFNEDEAPF